MADDTVTVMQADRDAADTWRRNWKDCCGEHTALVQAFARHRIANRPALDAGEWPRGTRVTKTKGSSWTGKVVGFYSTDLTPEGYAVESENEPGSVQIYPRAALREASQ